MRSLLLAGVVLFGWAGAGQASPFTANYVFGDSLSDRGNLAEALGRNLPNPPFFHDSFTNGPTAVEVLAQKMGLTADPSLFVTGFADRNGLGLTPGTNYAVAGATAGTLAGVPGANLPNQVAAYLAQSGGAAVASALYTVFIGGNDVRTAAHQANGAFVTTGEAAEAAAVRQLVAAGAQNLLIVNVPDVGAIPEFKLLYPSQQAAATAYTVQYNSLLSRDIGAVEASNPTLNVMSFDLYNYNNQLIPTLGSLGITNTVDPCYTNTNVTSPSTAASAACGAIDPATGQATNISSFQYWDYIHPTARIQQIYGEALYDLVAGSTTVPEPASLALLGVGLAAVIANRSRRAA